MFHIRWLFLGGHQFLIDLLQCFLPTETPSLAFCDWSVILLVLGLLNLGNSVGASASGSGSESSTDTLTSESKSLSSSDQVLVTSIPHHTPSCGRFPPVSLMTSSHVLNGCPGGHPLRQNRMFHDDQLLWAPAVIKERASFSDVLCSS